MVIDKDKILEPIYKRWKDSDGIFEEDMYPLLLDLMLRRDMRPKGWFNLRYKPMAIEGPIDKILIIPLPAIGDTICTIPAILGLKDRFVNSSLSVLIEEGPLEIIADNPILDEIIVFPREQYISMVENGEKGFLEVVEELRGLIEGLQAKGFDLVINLHITSWSAIISYLVGARCISGLTIDDRGRSLVLGNIWMLYFYYIYCNPAMEGLYRFNFTELLMRMAGVLPDRQTLNLQWDEEEKIIEGLEHLGVGKDDLLIGFCPGGPPWRRWPPERFARLADILAQNYGAKIILFGDRGEVKLASQIVSMMKHKPLNLVGSTTLRELAGYLRRCKCLITNDTGPMHIAAAIGTPVIVICGPSYKEPYGSRGHMIVRADGGHWAPEEAVLKAFGFQIGKLSGPPQVPGVKFYYSGRDLPKRFFSYTLLNKEKIDPKRLSEEIIGLCALNLWIEKNNELGLYEEPISPEEMKDMLNRYYEIEDLDEGIRICIDSLREYEVICEEGIQLLEKIFLSGERDLVERFNRIEKKMNEGIGKHFSFLYFLFLKDDEVGWRINLYRTKQEACKYLQEYLKKWERKDV